MLNLEDKLKLAADVAKAAGQSLLKRRDFQVERKAKNDYVTEVDRQTEDFIRAQLLAACPEDAFYGEESGQTEGGSGRWVVDPIDGTTNFIRSLPIYVVSIGYQLEGELVIGAIYCPVTDELFIAGKGMGAYLNGEKIHVSDTAAPEDAILSFAFSHRHPHERGRALRLFESLTEINDIRRMGSGAYDLCLVACGKIDGFLELQLNLYDIAAGIVILREAGGVVTGWPGEADCTMTGNILAGNGLINEFLENKALAIS